MRSLWERGLRTWPYLAAVLAFLVSMSVALQYGMEHAWAANALSANAFPETAADDAALTSPSLQSVWLAVAASAKSGGAVIWPLMSLIVLLVVLRLGAVIAGIGYDCGRPLVLITVLIGSELLVGSELLAALRLPGGV